MILWEKWVYSLAITIEEKLSFKIYFLNFYIWSPYLWAMSLQVHCVDYKTTNYHLSI